VVVAAEHRWDVSEEERREHLRSSPSCKPRAPSCASPSSVLPG
jgi:hypothetical protein